ncbi:hypothetical protein BVI1335_990051 [Burkholderia vietnamiensis]|nr:hypothetical protein BVI1335_990051 [Burkholderia vietnamiensis]
MWINSDAKGGDVKSLKYNKL